MDRGFGSTFRSGGGRGGMNNSTPSRDRFSRDERRYDDFYSDNNNRRTSGGGGSNVNRNVPSNNAPNRNNNNNRGGWGNTTPTPRDRGFFNQGGSRDRGGAPPAGNNVSGQMLAALQQQQSLLSAFMNNQQQTRNRGGRGGGILGSGGNKFQGNRFNNRDNRGGNRAGDKRRQEPPQGNNQFKRNRRSAQGLPSGINPNKTTPNKTSSVKATTPKIERKLAEVVKTKEEEVEDIPDEDVVIPDSLMDSVERLRQRKEIERNVADEDVQKLVVFLFTGKGYQCATCGLLLSKEEGFVHHLMGKSHVMNVIDARSAKKYQTVRDILDIDLSPDDWFEQNEQAKAILFKQAKLFMKAQREIERRAKENYDKTPSNFFSVRMESRKSALKKEDTVIITSLVESTIEIKDFSKDRFFGCEFVKAVTGFQCRLCHIQIKEASDVIPHVNSKVHRNNYQMHLNKNKGYEKVQKDQNKELLEVLSEHEEKNVLLYESPKANDGVFLNHLDTDLVRDKKLLEPPVVKKPETTIDKKEAIKKDGDKVDVKEEEDDVPKVEGESEEANEDATTEVKEELKNDAALKDEKKEDDVTNDDAQETDEHKDDGEDQNDGEYDEAMEEDDTAKEGDDGETNEDGEQNEESESKGEDATEEHVENGDGEEAEQNDEVEDESKSTKVAKKTAGGSRGKGKRGRGRGAKVTPSPRSRRAAAIKAAEEISEEVAEEQGDEASFMDSFQVVDEVADE